MCYWLSLARRHVVRWSTLLLAGFVSNAITVYSPYTLNCHCSVPQGSILGPLLFITYTTPLSTLISSVSSNHHLYAVDTQLFVYFHPPTVSTATSLTHKTLYNKSLPGLLPIFLLSTLLKVHFFLIGLKQLSKIHPSCLNTTHSAIWQHPAVGSRERFAVHHTTCFHLSANVT